MISRAWGRERDGPVEKEASIQFTRAEIAKRDKRVRHQRPADLEGWYLNLEVRGGFALAWPVTPLSGIRSCLALREYKNFRR